MGPRPLTRPSSPSKPTPATKGRKHNRIFKISREISDSGPGPGPRGPPATSTAPATAALLTITINEMNTQTWKAAMALPHPSALSTLDRLEAALDGGIPMTARAIDVHANAHDASHFLLIPEVQVVARNDADVAAVLRSCARLGIGATLRSGGTSLSGQALTDGVLVDVRRNFRKITVLDDGLRVRVQPGATVRQVNNRLLRYRRKLGPDPASESACTIGGVVANNSSGMACGIEGSSYHTVESMTFVLPSGTIVDTARADANERLRHDEPELFEGLLRLRDRVRSDPESVRTITHQFSMKNTMGYGLNAFLDFDQPADILSHVVIGSEGTLGFVAEVVFRTLPLLSHAATGLVLFDDLIAANEALPEIVASGAVAVELMDTQSLRVGARDHTSPDLITGLDFDRQAALLVEYQAETAGELDEQQAVGETLLRRIPRSSPTELSRDPAARAALWHLRKGLYATVAEARPQGTTALLEDIVVPVEALADTCTGLIALFERYEYTDSVIFGHAKDGNVHFMLTDLFEGAGLDRFSSFTEDMVELVLGRGGSLKAEHGTGRVMAPFVERQYGSELYAVMRTLKSLCDPTGMLNPGVIINDDPTVHLRNIKRTPSIEIEADRCVECGYCEPVCPSRDLTLTPRQRIVVKRAIAAAELDGDLELARELERDYEYDGVQTCAVDGMCQTACPVSINTGDLVRTLRKDRHSAPEKLVWNTAAKHWSATTGVASLALSAAKALPAPLIARPNSLARSVVGKDVLPLWSEDLPGGGAKRSRRAPTEDPEAVYFPACVNAMFGPVGGGVQRSFEELCELTSVTVFVPEDIDRLCCGTPWSSKGLPEGAAAMRERVLASLRKATRNGTLPIICDASSCTEGLIHTIETDTEQPAMRIVDVVEFVADRIVPLLPEHERIERLVLHPTCSSTRLALNPKLAAIAEEVAGSVLIPDSWGCCGFAGDRGMLHPELTESATREQAEEIRGFGAAAHASCNRTCELGMTRATGSGYQHILELLADQCRLEHSEGPVAQGATGPSE